MRSCVWCEDARGFMLSVSLPVSGLMYRPLVERRTARVSDVARCLRHQAARTHRSRTDGPHGERAKEPHDCDEGPAWKQFQAGFLVRLTSAALAGISCRRRRAAAS